MPLRRSYHRRNGMYLPGGFSIFAEFLSILTFLFPTGSNYYLFVVYFRLTSASNNLLSQNKINPGLIPDFWEKMWIFQTVLSKIVDMLIFPTDYHICKCPDDSLKQNTVVIKDFEDPFIQENSPLNKTFIFVKKKHCQCHAGDDCWALEKNFESFPGIPNPTLLIVED
ncbi:hypothetical protein WN51_02112 [Melipona quadrifasciata]|uniref:Uncharacterized protein n=1 Tax=Melipona quadrifasciata TaxID=166423 RepID=A0A0M8ZZ56_9HYME|nr:hypothetical protein WN51_02112 [Melipona quadrifasciata]